MEIVDYLVENVQFFVVGITSYYYEHGVFLEDHDGVRMKYRIQKLIYRDQVQSGVIKRIYNLLSADHTAKSPQRSGLDNWILCLYLKFQSYFVIFIGIR